MFNLRGKWKSTPPKENARRSSWEIPPKETIQNRMLNPQVHKLCHPRIWTLQNSPRIWKFGSSKGEQYELLLFHCCQVSRQVGNPAGQIAQALHTKLSEQGRLSLNSLIWACHVKAVWGLIWAHRVEPRCHGAGSGCTGWTEGTVWGSNGALPCMGSSLQTSFMPCSQPTEPKEWAPLIQTNDD